ncbi:MAG: hypothetical protein HY812_20715 [Planctomycetes bacterium]|nr:hypothetical protein [Planctomycetota bacterium]
MRPGPVLIVACPRCGALARHGTLASGNTFGARLWSDGMLDAPMLPLPREVGRCTGCGKYYWLEAAREVGSVDAFADALRGARDEYSAVPWVEDVDEAGYYRALQEGLGSNRKKERLLRMRAWWRRNDAFREEGKAAPAGGAELPEACRLNLEALAGLLDGKKVDDRLLRAEVLRELGQFGAARAILASVRSPKHAGVARQLLALCEARDAGVRELRLEG